MLTDTDLRDNQVLREGAALIRQQMAERDEQRLADKAAHEEEVRSTLERIRQLQEDEKRARAERQRAQHALLEEISKINAAAVEAKHRAKIETQEEDARIMEYLLRKEEEQDRLERQEAERKQQREKEIAELRSMQQRAVDTNAQMDELRAQKAAFEFEQEGRRKEAEAAEKKEKERKELREERERQRCAREHAIAIEVGLLSGCLATRIWQLMRILFVPGKQAQGRIHGCRQTSGAIGCKNCSR